MYLIQFLPFFLCTSLFARLTNDSIKIAHYIHKFSDFAIEQEIKYGIPAIVTLAQAIIESDAGTSLLTQISNNHFGIKSHKEWQGESVYYHDDTLYEKFRKYTSDFDSFEDHSLFLLSRPRYKSLFKFDRNQWLEWCFGLQECGYATSKDYGAKLINVIEKFNLFSIYIPDKLSIRMNLTEAEKEIVFPENETNMPFAGLLSDDKPENLLTFAGKTKLNRPKSDY
jgi:hypothetical protein